MVKKLNFQEIQDLQKKEIPAKGTKKLNGSGRIFFNYDKRPKYENY